MRPSPSHSSSLQKVNPVTCDSSNYPEIKILNTTSMEWTHLRCAPSAVQAALDLAGLCDPQNADGSPEPL